MSRRIFNIIGTNAQKVYDMTFGDEHPEFTELDKKRIGFYFLSIETILGLDDETIKQLITDTDYHKKVNNYSADDYGLDGIYIDHKIKLNFLSTLNRF